MNRTKIQKKQSGVAIIISILLIGILLSIVITLSGLFATKIRLTQFSKESVAAVYAAESGAEWCLYRRKDTAASNPGMINGATYVVSPIATVYQPGVGNAYSTVEDSSFNSSYQNANYGANKVMRAYYSGNYKMVIKFPNFIGYEFGQITPNSTITSATLRLAAADSSGNPINLSGVSYPFSFYYLLKSWNQGAGSPNIWYPPTAAIDGEVTYNTAQYNILPWQTAGATNATDRQAVAVTSSPGTAGTPSFFDFDVTVPVQAWVNSGMVNNGFLIEIPSGGSSTTYFSTSEATNGSYRPMLSVRGSSCAVGNIKAIGTYKATTRALEVVF